MSGSSRPSNDGLPMSGGFTLLELLIVLALVAVMAAMVAPRLQRSYDAIVASGERAEVVRQIERLPLLARAEGRRIVLAEDAPDALARLVDLPEGWTAVPAQTVEVEASGTCRPFRVLVASRGVRETWHVTGPACEVSDAL